MKKIIIALICIFVASYSAFAATSPDIHENVYLRQDVFEAKMDAFMAEIKLMNQNMRSEFKQDINEFSKAIAVLSERTDRNFDILSARIDSVHSRIDDLRNGLYLWLVVIGTFLAWPKAKNLIQNMHSKRDSQKQSFTLDDIEKLIDARINSKFRS